MGKIPGKKKKVWSGEVNSFDCCICLEKKRNRNGATDIFEPWTPLFINCPTSIATEMSKLANVELDMLKKDDDPTLICKSCFIKLDIALKFIIDIQQAAKFFNNRLGLLPHSAGDDIYAENSEDLKIKEEIEDYEEMLADERGSEGKLGIKYEDDGNMNEKSSPDYGMHSVGAEVDSDTEPDPLNLQPGEDQSSRKHRDNMEIFETFEEKPVVLNNTGSENKVNPTLCGCDNDCMKKISKSQMRNITAHFKTLKTVADRSAFVKNLTIKEYDRGTNTDNYKYFLPKTLRKLNAEKIPVCPATFQSVLPFDGNVCDLLNEEEDTSALNDEESQRLQSNIPAEDTIISICDHFRQLQRRRLKMMELKYSGVLKKPVEKLTFNKMFKLYTEWFKSTNYNKKPRTLREYKNILTSNINMNHILTLQRCCKPRPVKVKVNKNIKEKKIEIIMGQAPMKKVNQSKMEIEYLDDNFDEFHSDDEDRVSVHSNFSEDFKKEKQTTEQDVADSNENDNKSDSDCEISDEEEKYNIDDIKKEIIPKKSTRSSNPIIEIQEQVVELNFGEDIKELLTEKTREITTDSSIIRKYCKVRGLPYVTNSGRVVPKKTLGPACNCSKWGCTDKISEQQRQYILEHYYHLANVKKQCAFVVKFTERIPVLSIEKKRDNSLRYYLPLTADLGVSAPKVRVCHTMFLNTLACNNARPFDAWTSFDKDPTFSGALSTEESKQIAEKCLMLKNLRYSIPEIKTNEIDFVYRAMPFEEFMSCFSSRTVVRNLSNSEEIPLAASCSTVAQTKDRDFIRLMNKLLGKRYIRRDGKICSEKVMGPPCNCLLRHCTEKISEEQRKHLFKYFWSLGDIAKQRAFLIRFTEKAHIKRVTVIKSKRIMNYKYFLPLTNDFDGEKVQVCSRMFNNTLAVELPSLTTAWRLYAEGLTLEERRGKSKVASVMDDENAIASVRAHIDSLRAEDPELNSFTITDRGVVVFKFRTMYDLYEKWFDPSKFSSRVKSRNAYRKVLLKTLVPGGKYDYSAATPPVNKPRVRVRAKKNVR